MSPIKLLRGRSGITSISALIGIASATITPLYGLPDPAEATDTTADIKLFTAAQTVFERSCYECHGPTTQRGEYRLDLKRAAFTPGDSELKPIVPGNLNESELIYRILLDADDDDVMPPKKKSRISEEDINVIKEWVASGAHWPDQSELDKAPSGYVKIGNPETDALIKKINQTGSKAEYNAWGDESVRIDLGVVYEDELQNALQMLSEFGDQLAWLDCSHLDLPDRFYKELSDFENLERLHLDSTTVSDTDLKSVSQLPKLNYLNLYKTSVSDQGIQNLKNCSSLQKLYLTDTKVSRGGIASLQSALPDLQIIFQ